MNKRNLRYIVLIALLVVIVSLPTSDILAQCPMCRAAAETNLAQGGTEGKGLNKGILYMLSLPYLLVATIGFIWWRNKKKESNAIDA